MRIDSSPRADGTTVAVAGEVDMATVGAIGDEVRARLRTGPVLLDLARVTFMDSSGVRMLDGLLRDAAAEGWELRIAPELTDAVEQVLELTGMRGQLPFEDREEPA
jgi:anti-sigma B factor antagonist